MVNGLFTYTRSGKKRAPSKELVLLWVNKAWQEIPAELVIRSLVTHICLPVFKQLSAIESR